MATTTTTSVAPQLSSGPALKNGTGTPSPPPVISKVDSVMSDASTTTNTTPSSAGRAKPAVRILQLHEWKEAAASIAEAFKDDEVSLYFLDTPEREQWTAQQKWDLHLRIMEFIVYAHLLKGLVVCAGPDYDCVALWMPPGKNMDDLFTIFRSGMWRLNYLLCKEGRVRFFNEFLPLLNHAKADVMKHRDDDSYYLVYLGTRPSGRGKGYARAVVEHVSNMADEEGRACYLESSHPVNRQIYQKLGFELRKNIYLQRAGQPVEMDIMVREPVGVEGLAKS